MVDVSHCLFVGGVVTQTITFETILISNNNSSGSPMVRVADKVEAMVVEEVPEVVNNTRGCGDPNLLALPRQQPKCTLESLFGSLHVLFDIGKLLSFMSSRLVHRL